MIILPSYMGIVMTHYKDPYKPTSIMESKKGFFGGSHFHQLYPKNSNQPHLHIQLWYFPMFSRMFFKYFSFQVFQPYFFSKIASSFQGGMFACRMASATLIAAVIFVTW